jgi:hypothetical protein
MGVFDPDGTRSGLLLQQAGAAVGSGLDEALGFWAEATGAEAEQEGAVVIDDDENVEWHDPVEGGTGEADGLEELEHYAPVHEVGDGAVDSDTQGEEWTDSGAKESEPALEVVEACSSSSSSSSSSAESSEGECEESFVQSQSNEAILHVSPAVPGPLLQNRKSKMLHKPGNLKSNVTLCGAKTVSGYERLQNASFSWPRCARCFRGEVLSTKKDLVDFLDSKARGST